MSIIDQILKPFSERLKSLEKNYEEHNNNTTSTSINIQDKLKSLIFKDIKKPSINNYFDFDSLPTPAKNNILDMLEFDISDKKFAKKLIEYRLLEIKKQLLVYEQLVIQYMHCELLIQKYDLIKGNNNNDIDLLIKCRENIVNQLNYIVNDENIVIFNKIYCKNTLLDEYYKKLNEE
jgi:hypothetical protein